MSFDFPTRRAAQEEPSTQGDVLDRIRALFPNDAPGRSTATLSTAAPMGKVASAERSSRSYDPGSVQDTIVQAANRHGVDPAVMLALAESESSFDPTAVSRTGATGLFQFTKGTAKQYGVDRRDPASSADGAARYMRDLLASNNNDLTNAISQYKGVSVGGATMDDVRHTIAKTDKYRDGSTVRSTESAVPGEQPAASGSSPDGRPSDVLDRIRALFPNDKPGASTVLPTPVAALPAQGPEDFSGVSTKTSNQATPFAGVRTKSSNDDSKTIAIREMRQREKEYRKGFDQGNVGNDVATRPEFLIPDAVKEAGDRLNSGIKAIAKAQIGEEGVAGIKGTIEAAHRLDDAATPIVNTLAAVTRGVPGPAKVGLQIAEGVGTTLTGGVAQTLFPKTMSAVHADLSTGSPIVDEAISQGSGLAAMVLAPEIAIPASAVGSGARVASGEETPLAGLAEAGLNVATIGGYHAVSKLPGAVERVLAGATLGAASETAGAGVHGEAPTVGGLVGSTLAGGALSVPGGHGVNEHAATESAPSIELKAKVDERAHEAATSPQNDRPEPTVAQQDAGNYKKGHVTIQGLGISIENPEGSVRSGVNSKGEPWSVTMKDHYGYIKGTEGADGQHIDTFLGPDLKSDKVFIVDQINPSDKSTQSAPTFDEHKVVLGAHSAEEATKIYKRNYSDDAEPRIGAITEASMPEFKKWIAKGETAKPFDPELQKIYDRSKTDEQPPTNAGELVAADRQPERTATIEGPAAPLQRPGESGGKEVGEADRTGNTRPYTRGNFEVALADKFKLPPDERLAVMALSDARADQWAKENNRTRADYYTERIAGITDRAAPEGSLKQSSDDRSSGGTDGAGLQGEMFNAKNEHDALAYSLSGLTRKDVQRLTDRPAGLPKSTQAGIDNRRANALRKTEQARANAFDRERRDYARYAAPEFKANPDMDPDQFFKKHPDAELDFLRGRQQKTVGALQAAYPDVKAGYGFLNRLLDAHKEAFNDPLVKELGRNHAAMVKLPEVPVRAALKFEDGHLALGRTHNEALDAAETIGLHGGQVEVEGFFTNHNRFVGREDAAKLVGKTGHLHSEFTVQRMRDGEPVLYQNKSKLKLKSHDVIDQKMKGPMAADQLAKTLLGAGVKPEELQYTGLKDFLDAKGKEKVTPDEAKLAAAPLGMKAIKLGEYKERGGGTHDNSKYSEYALPGGSNYREVVITDPGIGYNSPHFPGISGYLAHYRLTDRVAADGKKMLFVEEIQSDLHQKGRSEGYRKPFTPELSKRLSDARDATGEADRLAAIAQSDRDDLRLKAILEHPELRAIEERAEELQKVSFSEERRRELNELSHRAIAINREIEASPEVLRSRMAADAANRRALQAAQEFRNVNKEATAGVPDAPFKKTWHELAFRRILQDAVEKGYDRVAWTTGEQQAERYNLQRLVDALHYKKNADGSFLLSGEVGGRGQIFGESIPENKLPDYVGKEVAQRIATGEGADINFGANNEPADIRKELKGDGLKVGGEGMKGFYDKVLLDFVNKYAKKWGGNVGEAKIPLEREFIPGNQNSSGDDRFGTYREREPVTVHSLDITPKMREDLKTQGQYLFQHTDTEPKGAVSFRQDGKAIIHAFQSPDVSTVVHELAHIWRRDLSPALLRDAEQAIGVTDGTWTRDHEEQFARGFERYLRDGHAPTAKLANVFERFKAWLTTIYQSLKGSPLEKRVSPELKKVFDRMLGGTGEHAADREPIKLVGTGRDTYMRVGDEKIPVKYALVEAQDVQLSHDPITFAKNDNYVGENQNDYEHSEAMQASVQRGIAETDWDTIHSQTKTSTEGPTVIDQYGQAAGGNGRGMMQKGVYAARPEEAKNAAIQNADRFGLDPAVAARMDQPMIVRVQPQDVSKSVESRRNIAAHNLSVTKSRTTVEDGVDLAKRFTPENKRMLADALTNVERMSDLTTSEPLARPVIKVLRDAKQITVTNQSDYITSDSTLTNKGRELVEGATIGMAIPNAQLVNKLPGSFRQKLAENLPQLGSVEATKGWELNENLQRITDYNEARQRFVDRGGVKQMYDVQGSLLPESERPPALNEEDHVLMKLLEDPKRTKFKEFMSSYAAKAEEARAGTIDFSGEPMTRERAFEEARQAMNIPERGGIAGYFDKTKAEDDEYIRKNLGKSLSMNMDPELAARLMRRGAGHIVDGLNDFAEWSKRMVDEFGERVRSDLQELYDGARAQVLAHRGEGIRGTVHELAEAYRQPPEKSTLKTIIGKYTGAQQMIDHELLKFAKEIKAAIPDKARREAITNYIQADGREALLTQRASESSEKYRQGYLDAANLTPAEKDYAQDFRQRMEETWRMANDAGVLEGYVENYVRGEYERDPEGGMKLLATVSANGFQPNPKEALHKIYQSYFDAEKAGLTPKDKDIARQVIANERNLKMAIEARKAIASMMHSLESDGRPTVLVGGMDGRLGTQAEGDPDAPYLIKPNAVGKDGTGYRDFDHPALRKWKWIANDDQGKAILLQGDMKVNKLAYGRLNALLGRSKIQDYVVPARVPVIGGTQPGAAGLKASSFVKGTIMLGPFHQFHLGEHALFHETSPFAQPEIDFDKRPLLREGVEHGLMLVSHNAMKEFGEGLASGGLLHRIPGIGNSLNRYQEYLFQDYIPRIKAAMFENALGRAEERYAGELLDGTLTRDQLLDNVAKQANAAFGELNYKYMGRNPTVQHLLHLAFVAPDFLEARLKFAGQALRPYGHEQRMALLRGSIIMGATAQITNLLFGDDHKMRLDRPFSVIIGGREYGPRSVVGDIAHLITDPRGFWYYRLNPLFGRPLAEMVEGRNSFGEKIGVGEAALDILKSWTPIPMQGVFKKSTDDSLLMSIANALLGSVGISNTPYKTGLDRFVSDRYFAKLPSEKQADAGMKDARSELREAYRNNLPAERIQEIKTKYGITEAQATAIKTLSKSSQLAYSFSRLTLREMAEAFDSHLSDIRDLPGADRSKLQNLFARKIANANPLMEMSEAEKSRYRQKYSLGDGASSGSVSSGNALVGMSAQ